MLTRIRKTALPLTAATLIALGAPSASLADDPEAGGQDPPGDNQGPPAAQTGPLTGLADEAAALIGLLTRIAML